MLGDVLRAATAQRFLWGIAFGVLVAFCFPSRKPPSKSSEPSCAILLGIFTTSDLVAERNIIRGSWQKIPYEACRIETKFVVGKGPASALAVENRTFSDIIELDVEENMDDGKTYHWFKYAVKFTNRFNWVAKMDMDTFLYQDRLACELARTPRRMTYGGKIVDYVRCGGHRHCPKKWIYMEGPFYFLSSDLVSWLAGAPGLKKQGLEDLVTGSWLHESRRNINYVSLRSRLWVHPVKNSTLFWNLMPKDLSKGKRPCTY